MRRERVTVSGGGQQGAVRWVTVPGGHWDHATAGELVDAAGELVDDRSIRVVVLAADGPDFCLGPDDGLDPLSFRPDPAAVLSRLRPPVVAVIGGRCASVGLEVALACDIRICHPEASFAVDHLAGGRLPCWGGTQRLARAVRPAEATALLLLGKAVDAERALQLGLVHQVADDPVEAAHQVAATLTERGPLALELAKEAVHRGAELPLRDGLRLEGDLNHLLAATDDRAEGLAAFFDKRPPDFAGR